jgi:hypothetical protein
MSEKTRRENRDEARKAVRPRCCPVHGKRRQSSGVALGPDALPPRDGDDGRGMSNQYLIGRRDSLRKREALIAAEGWGKLTARYPRASFLLMIAGYDDDPREIWEFPEVCRYVRQWAKATGLDNPDVAHLWLGSCEGRPDTPLQGPRSGRPQRPRRMRRVRRGDAPRGIERPQSNDGTLKGRLGIGGRANYGDVITRVARGQRQRSSTCLKPSEDIPT